MRARPVLSLIAGLAPLALGAQVACSGSELSGASPALSDVDTADADAHGDVGLDAGDGAVLDTALGDIFVRDSSAGDSSAGDSSVGDSSVGDGSGVEDGSGDTTQPPPQWAARSLGDVGVISDLFVVSPHEAYAVGGRRVLRYNGRGWASYGEPSASELFGVWAGDGVVVVVGAGGVVATRATGERAWVVSDSGVSADLHGVYGRSANDVWAFGDGTTVVRWDGAAWVSEFELANIDLRAGWIAAGTSGPEGVYAVGTGGQLLSYAGHWKTEQIAAGGVTLRDIYGVDDTLFAVGSGATITIKRPLAPTWQGQLSNDPKDRDLFAIVGPAADDIVAFGEDGAVIEFDGDNWSTLTPSGPGYASADLVTAGASVGAGGSLWMALGASGGGLRRDAAGAWVDVETHPEGAVRDLGGRDAGALYAVGRDGLFVVRGAQGWTAWDVATDADLNAVSVAPSGVVWAVGAAGTVVRIDEDNVTFPDALVPLELFDVVATDEVVWACGKGGTLLRLSPDGEEVTISASGTPNDLKALAFGGDGALWLGGAFGTLMRAEGDGVPVAVNSGVGGAINDLAPTATGVMVVGDNGVVLDASAAGVELRHEDPGLFLFGAATGGGAEFAVGWNGVVLRREGDGFVTETSGVNGVLEAVWTDGQEAIAVGRQGTLIERLEAP